MLRSRRMTPARSFRANRSPCRLAVPLYSVGGAAYPRAKIPAPGGVIFSCGQIVLPPCSTFVQRRRRGLLSREIPAPGGAVFSCGQIALLSCSTFVQRRRRGLPSREIPAPGGVIFSCGQIALLSCSTFVQRRRRGLLSRENPGAGAIDGNSGPAAEGGAAGQ